MHPVFNVQDRSPIWCDQVPPIALPLDPSRPAPSATIQVDIVLDYKAYGDPKVIDRYLVKQKNCPKFESC